MDRSLAGAAAVAALTGLSIARLSPPIGSPTIWGVLAYAGALIALLRLAPAPNRLSEPVAGALAGATFWGLHTLSSSILGRAGYSGISLEPVSAAITSAWAVLGALVGIVVAWAVSRAIGGQGRLVVAAIAGALPVVGLAGLLGASSAASLLRGAGLALIVSAAAALVLESRGFWVAAGFYAGARLLLVISPIVGGVEPLPRLFSGLVLLVGLAVVLGGEAISPIKLAASTGLPLLILLGLWLSGVRAVVVVSGSMEPTVGIGDIAIVRTGVKPDIGDVALYEHGKSLVLHRVVGGLPQGYKTQGDANPEPDPWTVEPEDVRGVMIARVPLAGKPLIWLRAALGSG
ncbi:MAG: signal peptidase I [Desulfurococcales archaeon]|nr:signal peptidase I [Desulfurococcales archaeon]